LKLKILLSFLIEEKRGRINDVKPPLIGVGHISYTAGGKVNVYNGAGNNGPAPLLSKMCLPALPLKDALQHLPDEFFLWP